MPLRQIYLSLGSNLGDRKQNLEDALLALEREKILILKRSSLYETAPQDVPGQPWFLNLVVACETDCFPLQLLAILQRIEHQMGRVRQGAPPRGPRLIDLDILLFGSVRMQTPQLELPHPRMLARRFVLEPLLEIAPGLRLPGDDRSLSLSLEQARSQIVRKL